MKNEDQKLMNYECEGRQETQGINLWIQHVITKQKTRIKRRVLRNKNEKKLIFSRDNPGSFSKIKKILEFIVFYGHLFYKMSLNEDPLLVGHYLMAIEKCTRYGAMR